VINTNLIGTINAIQVALPHLGAGAAIIATGSTAALMDTSKKDAPGNDPGGMAYVHSKRALANYVTTWQPNWLRWGFAPTLFTRRTATPRCCRASRCTALSGRTSNARHAPTPSRSSACNRR
jgi:NAD(P)-dependent dehydrogenase (short-subunit alcohol dehydrogenase family)